MHSRPMEMDLMIMWMIEGLELYPNVESDDLRPLG